MGKKDQLLMEYEPEKIIKQMAGLIEELERIEKIKVTRQVAVSERQREIVLEELREDNVPQASNILQFYNKWSKLMINAPRNFDKNMADIQIQEEKARKNQIILELQKQNKDELDDYVDDKKDEQKVIKQDETNNKIDKETQEMINKRKKWGVAMSEEISEILKDYRNYQLHEHLFDGEDDVQLTRLDLIFDDITLDLELYGKEEPSHQLLMSFVGGILSVPLYLIMNYLTISRTEIDSKHPPVSFMGIIESNRYPHQFNFYSLMFGSRWENIAIMLTIAVLYLLKPLFTTRFILSLPPHYSSLTYITTEVFSKCFYVFISLVCIEKETMVPKLQAFGLIVALSSQFMYYLASYEGGRKNRIEIQTAIQAVREAFHYETVEELVEVEYVLDKLDPVKGPLNYMDTYPLLLDVILAKTQPQLTQHLNFSSLQTPRFFDTNFHLNTYLWAGSYPRPSSEILNYDFVIQGNQNFEKFPKDELFMVPGSWVYDTASFKKLTEELKQKETDSKKEDLVAEPVVKSTFPRNKKRRQVMVTTETKLNESKEEQTPNETQIMHTAQNLLMGETKTPVENNESFEDNQSSIIIDELSNNYSDGLDNENDSEVDIKIYDKPEEKQIKQHQQLGVSTSQFYQTTNKEVKDHQEIDSKEKDQQEIDDHEKPKKLKKKKKKVIQEEKANEELNQQFKIQRKQSMLEVEDIK